jgi:hypothetical protein
VTGLYFDQIESCFHRLFGCGLVSVYDLSDFLYGQGVRILSGGGACHGGRGLRFDARSLWIGGRTGMVEVEAGQPIFVMDDVNDLF